MHDMQATSDPIVKLKEMIHNNSQQSLGPIWTQWKTYLSTKSYCVKQMQVETTISEEDVSTIWLSERPNHSKVDLTDKLREPSTDQDPRIGLPRILKVGWLFNLLTSRQTYKTELKSLEKHQKRH